MRFITLEGIEGSGKTTQIQHVLEHLSHQGHKCMLTREPGGTKIGEKIRAILLDGKNHDLVPVAELLLYMADRAQHLSNVVKPGLAAGKTVICDRYFDATLVYQGYARGLSVDLINNLHSLVFDDFKPDLTLLLDLSPELGLKRAWNAIDAGDRVSHETRFESEKLDFHRKVREGYLALAALEPERFRIIDASRCETDVRQDILRNLTP
ncbi:MAG: dTMP kinase [Desulfobacteraceae bacterium]|nr:dTMP kinase [Desulfobacteraceae bacterium]MBU4002074.1 dTMP kinase [Pseudomonadota bacterium]